jgi:hypothetical protein
MALAGVGVGVGVMMVGGDRVVVVVKVYCVRERVSSSMVVVTAKDQVSEQSLKEQ